MKKYIVLAFALMICMIYLPASAQKTADTKKIKEGRVTFQMTYPPDTSGGANMLAQVLPKTMVVYFKNGSSRMETKIGGRDVVMIARPDTNEIISLVENMGNKMALKMNKNDVYKNNGMFRMEKPEITYTEEYKTIAFYKCRKAIMTTVLKDETKTAEVWITNEIDNIDMGQYTLAGIDGFPMEVITSENGSTMRMLCTSIEQVSVPAAKFAVPVGYKVTTMEEIMKSRQEQKQ